MKLLLIDGNSVLFRAYYATAYGQVMKTSKGVYTNAIYAFANMLNKALDTISPDYCAIAFDKGKHTFRHDIAPDYKAGRKETPIELVEQFSLAREMLDAYNLKYLEFDDIEADDIIGSLAKKYPDIETCILTSDRDMLQLIDDTTSVYIMKKGMSNLALMDEKALKEEYGLTPLQIIDYKGLAGDKSDNIKGVEGIGDKTAVKLLNDYGSCEGIYEHIDEIKGKLKEKLQKDKESCFTSKLLATIKTDFDIPIELNELETNISEDTRNAFFKEYEMFSLIKKDIHKDRISKIKKVNSISENLFDEPLIYFLSNEFSYYNREIYGLSFTNDKNSEFITIEDLLKDQKTLDYIASDKKKVVFDLKAILHCLNNYQINIGDNTDDLLLMCFLANNYNNSLENILKNYRNEPVKPLKEIFGTDKKPVLADEKAILDYIDLISDNLYSIYQEVKDELKQKEMLDLYKNIELPLIYVLYDMENTGIYCDEKELNEIADNTKRKIDDLQDRIIKEVGHEFNISSPKQLAEVLYDELDLPDLKKGSTNAEVLSKLINYHPVISDILEYRKYTKLYSTYAEGLKKYIGDDQKIHTIFSQTITQTGRLSSYDPNLQNISIRDDESREIRKAFKAKQGHLLISSDYSQIELRVLSSLANEKKMIDAFNDGIDIHTKTAMDIFNLDHDEVDDLTRRHAKAVNFGVVYGISDFGLSNQTHLPLKEAKKFIEDYYETYPNIKEYLDNQVSFCKDNGYVKTILNRRRYINEINDANYNLREFGKRAAMNATIQGSAADIIKIAMINIAKEIKDNNLESKLLLQVHDELIFDVLEKEKDIMIDLIKKVMSSAYKLKTRLDYSLAIGKDWYEAK